MSKHPKARRPSDADLADNPLTGGSKGLIRAGADADDLDDLQGANTIEGDVENDTNAQGGLNKESRGHARSFGRGGS